MKYLCEAIAAALIVASLAWCTIQRDANEHELKKMKLEHELKGPKQ